MVVSEVNHHLWEQLHSLFGSILVLNEDLTVTYASESVRRFMPGLADAPNLLDSFLVQRPGNIASYDNMCRQLGSLFLLVAKDESFALRGQVIQYSDEAENRLIFCGSPWLFWLNTHRPDLKLGLRDFSAQDVQLDQLFYMSTEKRMVADLEALNSELQLAKEQLEAAQEAKSAFFAQMSHEMRTPLSGVVSALALLRDQPMTDDARDILSLARSSSKNLLRVINYVLDSARIEAAKAVEPRPFSIANLLESTSEIVYARAQQKNIALRTRVSASLHPNYLGDPDRLQQSMLNLAMNAIKFTDKGSVTIEALPAKTPECNVRFEVNDTGIGIPKEHQARIFEPFFSAPPDTAGSRDQSTGLGLDIVRRNTDSMGGRVGVSSAPGAGSCFWIELPLTETAASEKSVEIETETVTSKAKQDASVIDAHIMLVDDNETNRMLGTMVFESMGLRVTPVSSGEEAVQRADPAVYDLIFMDISLPGMDGYEATRAIRQQYDKKALPIVALSAYASSIERTKAEESGMNDYLTKPMQRDEGIEVLRKFLRVDRFSPTENEESASVETDVATVDTETLAALRSQIGDANLQTVIGKFQQEARQRWSALANAEDHQDRAREAHTLASTCSSFGLPPAAEALRKIEERAKQSTPEDAERLAEVGALLELSLVELEATLSRL